MNRRIFGLDFSGAEKAGRLIWLAEARQTTRGIQILNCRPAAELPGGAVNREKALGALRAFIAATPNAIFGCDFPFSLPGSLIAAKAWPDFLAAFDHADAGAFRQYCRARTGGLEPRRKTDKESKTPWCAFNIRLHHQTFHGLSGLLRPLVGRGEAVALPMQRARGNLPWIIETCPASTLAHLGCRIPYKGGENRAQRGWLVEQLIARTTLRPLPAAIERAVIDNKGGDALDSIIAALATAGVLQKIAAGTAGGDPLEGRVYFRVGKPGGPKSRDT